jgi:glycolate oxidase iron-sulfur subunit
MTASGEATSEKPLFQLITDETLLQCMHCGLCLPHCPTYQQTNLERYSPRGRIQLTRLAFENTLNDDAHLAEISDSINTCLGCLACQTACPAGVEYESIFEAAKTRVQELTTQTSFSFQSVLLNAAMKYVFPFPSRLKFLSRLLYVMQQSPLMRNIPEPFQRSAALAPQMSETFFDDAFAARRTRTPTANRTVSLLSGCIMNTAFADVHHDTVRVLESMGYTVGVPPSQICCGALNAHNGYLTEAKAMAKKNLVAFSENENLIVMNSAGCGAMMKHYSKLFNESEPDYAAALHLSGRVKDLSELLTAFEPTRKVDAVITYQDACHLEHGQKIRTEPREVLKKIFKTVVELNSPACCGSAGIYNVLLPEWSEKFLAEKVLAIKKTNADYVVTANPGCLLQLQYGLKRAGVKTKAIHFATAVAMSL